MGLSCIGVEVKRLQMGAAPFSIANEQIVRGHDNMKKEEFPQDQHYYLDLFGTPFSTFTPNAAVASPPENLLGDFQNPYTGVQYTANDTIALTTQGSSSGVINDYIPDYNSITTDEIGPLLIANPNVNLFLDVSLQPVCIVVVVSAAFITHSPLYIILDSLQTLTECHRKQHRRSLLKYGPRDDLQRS